MYENDYKYAITDAPLIPEYAGISAARTPFMAFISAGRAQMAATQATQVPVMRSPELARTMTGFEDQMSEYINDIRTPCNLVVKKIVQKYPNVVGSDKFPFNPLSTILYQDEDTGEYGYFDIPMHSNQINRVHETFSFPYILTSVGKALYKGQCIPMGTVIATSPSVDDAGLYRSGVNANVATMSAPPGIEDGFWVMDEYLHKTQPSATVTYTGEWGRKKVPVNTYGTVDRMMPFPALGAHVRDDGLLFGFRETDKVFNGIDMTAKELLRPDRIHDDLVYVEKGAVGGVVTDITIISPLAEGNKVPETPSGMETAAEVYADAYTRYWDTILDFYQHGKSAHRSSHDAMRLTPGLQTLITRALGHRPNSAMKGQRVVRNRKNVIKLTCNTKPVDEWRVSITITFYYPTGNGAKLSNRMGHKGVGCRVSPREHMPRDEFGNVCDVVYFHQGSVARLNPGQYYEHYINAVKRDVSIDIRALVKRGEMDAAWDLFDRYTYALSRTSHSYLEGMSQDDKDDVIYAIVQDGIYDVLTVGDPDINMGIVARLNKVRRPNKSRLTYVDQQGKTVVTRRPVLIGEIQMVVLDKIKHMPMAVSGVLRNHHGLVSPQNASTKHRTPGKQQAARVIGESESRTLSGAIGGKAVSRILTSGHDPVVHRDEVLGIMRADNPSLPHTPPHRDKPVRGRAIQFIHSMFNWTGISIVNTED